MRSRSWGQARGPGSVSPSPALSWQWTSCGTNKTKRCDDQLFFASVLLARRTYLVIRAGLRARARRGVLWSLLRGMAYRWALGGLFPAPRSTSSSFSSPSPAIDGKAEFLGATIGPRGDARRGSGPPAREVVAAHLRHRGHGVAGELLRPRLQRGLRRLACVRGAGNGKSEVRAMTLCWGEALKGGVQGRGVGGPKRW